MRPLPFPGYSWPLTQHAVGFSATTMYRLLQCASPFIGSTGDYGRKITTLIVEADLLTPNERDGKFDAWRDYQQLLAEIGLIYSTSKTPSRELIFTELGNRFLAGELGFAEMIGIQALKYQYPNGQKSTVSPDVKTQLTNARQRVPTTLTELHAENGVLIRPATLILRVLIELATNGHEPLITESEVSYSLLPCATNAEWNYAYAEIANFRNANRGPVPRKDKRIQRNIQDWFRLLACSDLFEPCSVNGKRALRMTAYALCEIPKLKQLISNLEDPNTFWVPTAYENDGLIGWFTWYGSFSSNDQLVLRTKLDEGYLKKNYVGGLDDSDEFSSSPKGKSISLTPVDIDALGKFSSFKPSSDLKALVEQIQQGMEKRHAKAMLHDQLVKALAIKYKEQGAVVTSDSDSIDLFARWPNGGATMFEVKTMTKRNFSERLRLAIGQIQEYGYRHSLQKDETVDLAVAIDSEFPGENWQLDFLMNRLGIGLVCEPQKNYHAYVPDSARTKCFWSR